MPLVIVSPTRIEENGADLGLPGTWLVANSGRLNEFNAAMVAWHQGHVLREQTREAEVVAAKSEARVELDALIAEAGGLPAIEAHKQAKADEVKAARRAELQKELAELDKTEVTRG